MRDLNPSSTRPRPKVRRVPVRRNTFIIIVFLILLIAALPQSGCLSLSGNLTPSQTNLSFGNVAIGSSSNQSLTFRNSSTAPSTITKAVASGGGFTVTGPPLPLTLTAGQSTTFMARFAPSAIGSASGSLLITSTQETTPQLTSGSGSATPSIATAEKTIAMAGTGVSTAPSITTQPASQSVTAGQTASFSVTSSGAAPLNYQWSKNGAAITGATSASYTTPATATSDSGSQFTVVISNSAGNVTSNAATLTVSATSPGRLNASASTLNFNSVNIGSSSILGVTFNNTGTSSIIVSNVSVSGAGYNASGMPTGLILTPGQTVILNVTFTPSVTGSVTGVVNVTSNASNSTASIILLGKGIQPAVPHSVTVAWPASAAPTVSGYNVYRATLSGAYTTPLNSSPIPASVPQFKDSTVQAGKTYYYVFTIVDSGSGQSPDSNEVSATIPTP
jgi:hypothetical protein